MRFDTATRAAIHEAAPGTATIRWPTGQAAPEKDRVYWLLSEEDERQREEKEARRRVESPETHAEVMAQMHKHFYKTMPEGYEPKKRRSSRRRPTKDHPRIKVLSVIVLERGFEAVVSLHEDPDPKRHTGLKTRIAAGPNPLFGHAEKVETEPEKIVVAPSRKEREDAEDALRIEHKASVDRSELTRMERTLIDQRRKGRRNVLGERAAERARKRAAVASAEGHV